MAIKKAKVQFAKTEGNEGVVTVIETVEDFDALSEERHLWESIREALERKPEPISINSLGGWCPLACHNVVEWIEE